MLLGSEPVVLDVPTLDQGVINYVKFVHLLGALGYHSGADDSGKELVVKLWQLCSP